MEEIEKNNNILNNYQEVITITNNEFDLIVQDIKTNFNDNLTYFIVFSHLKVYHEHHIKNNPLFENIVKKIASKYAKIIDEHLEVIKEDMNDEHNTILKIIQKLNISNLLNVVSNSLLNDEKKELIELSFKKNCLDSGDYEKITKVILIDIFNQEMTYEYYLNAK